jgi:hypothetical protein
MKISDAQVVEELRLAGFVKFRMDITTFPHHYVIVCETPSP